MPTELWGVHRISLWIWGIPLGLGCQWIYGVIVLWYRIMGCAWGPHRAVGRQRAPSQLWDAHGVPTKLWVLVGLWGVDGVLLGLWDVHRIGKYLGHP